jgi:class 3 adenylate cyclase
VAGQTLTLEMLLREHPWPVDAQDGRRLEYLWSFDLETSADQLWDHITDTSRLNRALGLGELDFAEADGKLVGRAVSAGIAHEWVEHPWNWVHGRSMSAERVYSRGLSRRVRVIYRLEPLSQDGRESVRFHAYFGFSPRSWWSGALLRLGMWPFRARLQSVLNAIAAAGDDAQPSVLLEPADDLTQGADRRLRSIRTRLIDRGMPAEVVTRLLELVVEADSSDLYRLQPRGLAHDWQLPERDVLRTFLHATRVGLLDLSWDVICPHCRGVRKELLRLGDVPTGDRCEPCAIEFGTDGANAIEITFHVHPSIREVPKQLFCSAQTSAKRHIEVQQLVRSGDSVQLQTALAPGRYRMRVQGRRDYGYLEVRGGDADGEVVWVSEAECEEAVARAQPSLQLVNDGEEPQLFIVEDVNWADEALRPSHLFAFQEFRDLFTEEFIHADVHLSVGEQTILFSDIVGSTALYIERGDPEAFVAVRKHFSEIYEIVVEHEGALVKTIGDATMATFGDALNAVRAARRLQKQFDNHRADTPIRLRCSLHTGVCIAVNLNSNIDYFGNTVNLAAKLQLSAGAGDIVFSEAVHASPGVASYLDDESVIVEDVEFDFKPLGRTITVHRWAAFEDDESIETRRA